MTLPASGQKWLDTLETMRAAIAELAAERDRAIAERDEALSFVQGLATAATGRDCPAVTGANVHRVADEALGAMAKLRAERDAARQELNELDIYLRCQGTQGDSALDRAKRIVARTSLPGYVRLVEERDAAVAKCAELERIAEQSRREGQEIAAGLHERIAGLERLLQAECRLSMANVDAHMRVERMLGVLRSDLESTNAALAAAKGKLAEAAQLLGYCAPKVQSYAECDATYCASSFDHPIRERIDAFLAAAEQGGA